MSKPPFKEVRFLEPAVDVERRSDGALVLRSPHALNPHRPTILHILRHWAQVAPQRDYLCERASPGGDWRRMTYGEVWSAARRLSQAFLERGLGADRAVMILSGNSVNHALVALGAMGAGVPVAPVSPAYSLISEDLGKLKTIFDLVRPGLVYVESGQMFQRALEALDLDGVDLLFTTAPPERLAATPLDDLLACEPGAAAEAAFAALGPDTVAKYLFTSGSTGAPKGVVNTQRMLACNAEMFVQCWAFMQDRPPVLVDWLPWNHTFGGNGCFNSLLRAGGTFYIDGGKPLPGQIETSVRNVADVSPTMHLNVPAAFALLLPFLERDRELRDRFFRNLDIIFYAGAALPQDLWDRLERLSIESLGIRVVMLSAWGATETAPGATYVHWPIERAGVIGLPAPGVAVKLVPSGSKHEIRVKGPNVMPGYLKRPELTAAAFDDEGFYRIGDAARLDDPHDPVQGLVFDGRIAEDFKLATGTWVHAGGLRVAALTAAAPALQDAVVTGHDRSHVGLLAWPDVARCREIASLGEDASAAELIAHGRVREHIARGLRRHNARQRGSSTRIRRVLLMAEPPSIDADEVTDKGYINQRAVLERRAPLVESLYAHPEGGEASGPAAWRVLVIPG